MKWGTATAGAKVYDLSHLDSFPVDVQPNAEGAQTYRVLVHFSHHVFTRDIVPTDEPLWHYGPPHDVRCICDQRHTLSLKLPDLIRSAVTGKAYFTSPNHPEQRNMLLVKADPGGPPYLVVFNLERARKRGLDAIMFVVSAHPRPGMPSARQMDSIRFPTLVAKIVRGEPITRPPKRK